MNVNKLDVYRVLNQLLTVAISEKVIFHEVYLNILKNKNLVESLCGEGMEYKTGIQVFSYSSLKLIDNKLKVICFLEDNEDIKLLLQSSKNETVKNFHNNLTKLLK